jgi:hypothetical protein
MSRAGLQRNAVYLVRPDGYVALVDAEGRGAAITSYLDARTLGSKRAAAPKSQVPAMADPVMKNQNGGSL